MPSTDDFDDVAAIENEVMQYRNTAEERLEQVNSGIPFSSDDEEKGITPIETAVEFVTNVVQEMDGKADKFTVYVVWYAYVLGGWKAMASTTKADGRYFEVTYNKEADEFYVDTYVKIQNTKFTNTSEEDTE